MRCCLSPVASGNEGLLFALLSLAPSIHEGLQKPLRLDAAHPT